MLEWFFIMVLAASFLGGFLGTFAAMVFINWAFK